MIKNDADDIEILYRDAKDKRNQINIISELYPAYSKDEIKEMLQERGYTIPRPYTKRKSKEDDKVTRTEAKKRTPAAGPEKSQVPESVLEAVRKQIVEVSSIIDDYQNKIADINTAMMEQQDKLQELDGFLKEYKE